ncbi:cytochrome P450 [Mastigocoleus testarum]|uniref:Cytochrome n=1 Tax=Mastigocoleus testarum BC008 TaxID=371196 RepID=A0A0V7ZN60_9CYAN|nr:cytochrome P450 [Mastigocoleus testarum]KST66132.1 cytochrome [Mastigocoleus testarum BC008]
MNSPNIGKDHKEDCPFHQKRSQIEKIGKEYQPFVSPQLQEPYLFYKRARKEGPIFYSSLLKGYVVTRYDDIISVLKDPTIFSSRDALQEIIEFTPETFEVLRQGFPFVPDLVNSDGDRHKLLRAPLQKVFAPARIKNLSASITAIANRLIDGFINDGKTDIITQFAYPLPLEVIFTLYGVPLEMIPDFKRWGYDNTKLVSSVLEPEEQVKCARSVVEMQYAIAKLIKEKRQAPQNDLISELQDSELTINDMVIVLSGLIIAGHKTTSHLIGNTLKILLEQPTYWQAICEDSSIIPGVLEEALRYDATVPGMVRTTNEEVNISGVKLPTNSKLFLMYASGNRDEDHYEDAQKFNIQRFQNKSSDHLAFGHGVHRCIGSHLALLEARIAFELLSTRLRNPRITSNQKLEYIPTLMTRGFKNLTIEWDMSL